jgi:hypothetical protein
MSSVGFKSSTDKELEWLREAYDSLKDVARGIESAQACIDSMNFGMAGQPTIRPEKPSRNCRITEKWGKTRRGD